MMRRCRITSVLTLVAQLSLPLYSIYIARADAFRLSSVPKIHAMEGTSSATATISAPKDCSNVCMSDKIGTAACADASLTGVNLWKCAPTVISSPNAQAVDKDHRVSRAGAREDKSVYNHRGRKEAPEVNAAWRMLWNRAMDTAEDTPGPFFMFPASRATAYDMISRVQQTWEYMSQRLASHVTQVPRLVENLALMAVFLFLVAVAMIGSAVRRGRRVHLLRRRQRIARAELVVLAARGSATFRELETCMRLGTDSTVSMRFVYTRAKQCFDDVDRLQRDLRDIHERLAQLCRFAQPSPTASAKDNVVSSSFLSMPKIRNVPRRVILHRAVNVGIPLCLIVWACTALVHSASSFLRDTDWLRQWTGRTSRIHALWHTLRLLPSSLAWFATFHDQHLAIYGRAGVVTALAAIVFIDIGVLLVARHVRVTRITKDMLLQRDQTIASLQRELTQQVGDMDAALSNADDVSIAVNTTADNEVAILRHLGRNKKRALGNQLAQADFAARTSSMGLATVRGALRRFRAASKKERTQARHRSRRNATKCAQQIESAVNAAKRSWTSSPQVKSEQPTLVIAWLLAARRLSSSKLLPGSRQHSALADETCVNTDYQQAASNTAAAHVDGTTTYLANVAAGIENAITSVSEAATITPNDTTSQLSNLSLDIVNPQMADTDSTVACAADATDATDATELGSGRDRAADPVTQEAMKVNAQRLQDAALIKNLKRRLAAQSTAAQTAKIGLRKSRRTEWKVRQAAVSASQVQDSAIAAAVKNATDTLRARLVQDAKFDKDATRGAMDVLERQRDQAIAASHRDREALTKQAEAANFMLRSVREQMSQDAAETNRIMQKWIDAMKRQRDEAVKTSLRDTQALGRQVVAAIVETGVLGHHVLKVPGAVNNTRKQASVLQGHGTSTDQGLRASSPNICLVPPGSHSAAAPKELRGKSLNNLHRPISREKSKGEPVTGDVEREKPSPSQTTYTRKARPGSFLPDVPATCLGNTQDTDAPTSHVVAFYRDGKAADGLGYTLSMVLHQSDAWLELMRNYIQWLFPLKEKCRVCPSSPQLTDQDLRAFSADVKGMQTKMLWALDRMLRFYGLEKAERDGEITVQMMTPFEPMAMWWMPHNHNTLRLTRIISSLRLFLLHEYADAVRDCLLSSSLLEEHPSREEWSQA